MSKPLPTRRDRRLVAVVAAGAASCLILVALALAASSRSSAPGPAKRPLSAGQRGYVMAGMPPVGVKPSEPENDGKLILQIDPALGRGWNIFADGRVIGDPDLIPKGMNPLHMTSSQQWLTPQGVQLLRSRILAIGRPVGLFTAQDHGFTRQAYVKHGLSDWYQIRIGHRLKDTQVVPTGCCDTGDPPETPAQIHALAQVNTLITRLPASAWKDRTARPYIPSHYCVDWDEAAPDPAKLPSPAKELLAQLLPSWSKTASGTLTTDQARALFVAFADAGLKLAPNQPGAIDWKVPTTHWNQPASVTYIRSTILRFHPGAPNGGC